MVGLVPIPHPAFEFKRSEFSIHFTHIQFYCNRRTREKRKSKKHHEAQGGRRRSSLLFALVGAPPPPSCGTLFASRERAHGANPKGLAWEAKSINSSHLSNAINSIPIGFPVSTAHKQCQNKTGKAPAIIQWIYFHSQVFDGEFLMVSEGAGPDFKKKDHGTPPFSLQEEAS